MQTRLPEKTPSIAVQQVSSPTHSDMGETIIASTAPKGYIELLIATDREAAGASSWSARSQTKIGGKPDIEEFG